MTLAIGEHDLCRFDKVFILSELGEHISVSAAATVKFLDGDRYSDLDRCWRRTDEQLLEANRAHKQTRSKAAVQCIAPKGTKGVNE